MSVEYGFYNASNHDRKYDATQVSKLLTGVIRDGVFATIGDALVVTAGTGMHVNVGSGKAWFNNTWTYNDSAYDLTVTNAHSTLGRIDTVVLEVNSTVGVRTNSFKVIAGTASSTPVAPTLTNTTYVHQYPLANISVPASATSILQSNITDRRGTEECPFVTSPLSSYVAEDLIDKWNEDFEDWFDELQDILEGDPATRLAGEILDAQADIEDCVSWEANTAIGAKNLIRVNNVGTHTQSSVTCTIGSDGGVTLSGTNNYNYPIYFNLWKGLFSSISPIRFPNTDPLKLTISGLPNSASVNTVYLSLSVTFSNGSASSITIPNNMEYTLSGHSDITRIGASITVAGNTTVSESAIYPMIRFTNDTDNTYAQTALTNR